MALGRTRMALGMLGVIAMAVSMATMHAVAGQNVLVQSCSATATSYFDAAMMGCRSCPGTLVAVSRTSGARSNGGVVPLDPLGNPRGCVCPAGYTMSPAVCDTAAADVCTPPTCTSCVAQSKAASRDGTRCMTCGTNSTLDATLGDCVCSSAGTHVLVEASAAGSLLNTKVCSPCPAGSRVFTTAVGTFVADRYTCQYCADPNATPSATGTCTCNTGYTAVGVSDLSVTCVKATEATALGVEFPQAAAVSITYPAVITSAASSATSSVSVATSLTFQRYYMAAGVNCYNYRTPQESAAYCNGLANLCVLQLYDTTTKVCSLYQRIASARAGSENSIVGWPTTLPFLYYTETASVITSSSVLSATMSFDSTKQSGTFDHLSFRLARYAVNGTFLGMAPLTNQFQYCASSSDATASGVPAWLQFGVNYQQQLTCDLSALVSGSEPELYDLYVVNQAKSSDYTATMPINLYPVPVRIVNLRVAGTQPNLNAKSTDESNDVLTRRFFLYDTVSGVEAVGGQPKVIRYASSIILTVTSQSGAASKITPPVLTLTYVERTPASFASSPKVPVTLTVQYTSDNASYWTAATALLVVCLVLVVLLCTCRMFAWHRRNIRTVEEQGLTMLLFRPLLFLSHSFVAIVFWLLFLLCAYWLVFFKLQNQVFSLLPLQHPAFSLSDYSVFTAVLVALLVCQVVRIAELLYGQCNVDVFFVDWEKPRGSEVVVDDRRGASQQLETKKRPVSIWRTILAVNEWEEIQTERKTYLPLTLITLVFLLRGLNLEFVANPQPNLNLTTSTDLNPALQFANATFWWLLIVFAQILFRWLYYERYVTEPPTTRFIDLCTTAKISALFLDESYHGFYLHCRSPYQHADCDMAELTEQLKREEQGLSTDRGLHDSRDHKDAQAFELFIPRTFRTYFNRVYGELAGQQDQSEVPTGRFFASFMSSVAKRGDASTARLLEAAQAMNKFLQQFINLEEATFTREWIPHGWMVEVFDMPPQQLWNTIGMNTSQNVTYIIADIRAKFERLTFRGIELDLTIFDILVFSVMNVLVGNSAISAFVTYIVYELLARIRAHYGGRNLARKTMVDERFLG